MTRFLVETEHNMDSCALVVGEIHSMGYLHHFEWGCDVDIHCGWAFIEAENEGEALLSVPLIVRPQARAVRLIKFTEEDFDRIHSEEELPGA
jgi:hypothetical protein